ncbi:hypothetical protein TRFO_22296 [Tritrichomonas foetus]|uniref:Importin N-terminal domain-containing protein n=1 Tax=Tritrichomonas foetus TaxID=1144522 RepID=A0A1J4KCM1_9EUKA|nr:hypothetical protein TRFO_22296 [Tritrichomonas foetus]|eukprot:OHT08963.1 hypothetical protein TRFO_22296 [Tritrichomonas foetus]
MDEELLEVLERAILSTKSNDNQVIAEATQVIQSVIHSNECFSTLIALMTQSGEPMVRDSASIYFKQAVDIKAITLSNKNLTRKRINDFIILCLNTPNISQNIANNMVSCIRTLVSKDHQLWPELDEYINQIQVDMNPFRIIVLECILPFLQDDFIQERFHLYGQISVLAITTSDNFEIIIKGISLMSELISRSNSLAGFEAAFARLLPLCAEVQKQEINTQVQFFSCIGKIIINDIFPPELITALLTFLSNTENDENVALAIFEAIEPAIKKFSLEQVFGLINLVIFYSAKKLHNDVVLPFDYMTVIDKCYNSFQHAQIYEFLKTKINEHINSCLSLAILLLSPTLSNAQEQLTKDIQFLLQILSAGLKSEDSLCIEACSSLIEEMADIEILINECFNVLFPLLLPLIVQPDADIQHHGFSSIYSLLQNEDIKHPGAFEALWSLKANIARNNYTQYLEALAKAIVCSEELNDSEIHEILQFLTPLFSTQDEIVAAALFVLGQIVCLGEFSEIESIIPDTFDAVVYCLTFKNNEIKIYALSYLLELTKTYGTSIIEMLSKLWPYIQKLILNKRGIERIKKLSLSIACKIAVLLNQSEIASVVIQALKIEYDKKHYDTFIYVAPKIAKILDSNMYNALYVMFIDICTKVEEIEQESDCFLAIQKFLKYIKEECKENIINLTVEVIKMFFAGDLPCLEGKSILNPEVDVDINLVDSFCEVVATIVSYPSQFVGEICGTVLKLSARTEEEYNDYVVRVFIDAIENNTIPQEVALQLANSLGQFMNTQNDSIQQNIVYLLIVILKVYPTFADSLGNAVQVALNWWGVCIQNKSRYAKLISNLASLFLTIFCINQQIPVNFIEHVVEFFPPNDRTETQNMSECILKIFSNPTLVTPALKNNTAVSLAKLLSETAKNIRKMNVNVNTLNNLRILFKNLCADEQTQQLVLSNFEGSNKKKTKILSELSS